MPAAINFADGLLVRPLLEIDQQTIKHYAQQQELQWIEDPSNLDMQFDRNFLRHQVIPLLEQRWPSLDKTIARVEPSAKLMAAGIPDRPFKPAPLNNCNRKVSN
jgi:tRNA(Ile)-lysidine synthase